MRVHWRKTNRVLLLAATLAVVILVTGACAPAPAAPPGATSVPAASSAPASQPAASSAPAAAGPKAGGRLTLALWQSPPTLNNLTSAVQAQYVVTSFIVEGLTAVAVDGNRIPALAKQVPNLENGGVSADGRVITYELKEGLLWSDGTPVTCEDVKFTWQAIVDPDSGATSTDGYKDIQSLECPTPQKVVMTYKTFYAPYLTRFDFIVPKSAGDIKNIKNWAYNRKPTGTGPFKLDEWVADDHVTLSRNPNYRIKDRPYLDTVIIRIVPSVDVAKQLLASGEVDMMWNPTEADVPELSKIPNVKIETAFQPGGERIYFNTAENKDGSDPTKPHPILGDVRVRQAIANGINMQRIIDKLLFGKANQGSSEVNAGFFNCTNVKPFPYDPELSKKLLTEAGWVPGADGIRVAKGAKYAPDGTRLRLKYSTTTGNKLREDSQVLILEDMKNIGIDMYIENGPSAVVIGTWDDASPRKRGNFDLIMYSSSADADPHRQMFRFFASSQIPSEKNKGGENYSRFTDPKIDDLLAKAAADPNLEKRRDMYCQIAQISHEQANMLYLYQRAELRAYRGYVQGVDGENPWTKIGASSANWWLNK